MLSFHYNSNNRIYLAQFGINVQMINQPVATKHVIFNKRKRHLFEQCNCVNYANCMELHTPIKRRIALCAKTCDSRRLLIFVEDCIVINRSYSK